MRKEKRQKAIRYRKNFLPTLIVTVFLWSLIAILIYFADPYQLGIVPLFFLLVFLALLFTFSTIFANARRGLLITIVLTVFLLLRYFGIGNILNFLLMLGLAISIDVYLSRN